VPGSAVSSPTCRAAAPSSSNFRRRRHPDLRKGFAPVGPKICRALKGTDLYNGWGSICYRGDDESFKGLDLRLCGCAAPVSMKAPSTQASAPASARKARRLAIPSSFGEIKMSTWGNDQYCRLSPATAKACAIDPAQGQEAGGETRAGYGAARQRSYDKSSRR